MPRPARQTRTKGQLTAITLLLIVLAEVGLIGVSPLALGLFRGDTDRWERFSFIGQTCGAASAIVSVLALVGVALTYQARETRRAREETRRQAIGDLLQMAMNDPDLDECRGPIPAPDDAKTRKQQLYINMIISEWEMSFETKALPEHRLRAIANEMFHGNPGRDYWRTAGAGRLSTSANRTERRFHRILDEEYHKSPEPAVQPSTTPRPAQPPLTNDKRRTLCMALGTGALMTAAAAIIRHRRVRRNNH